MACQAVPVVKKEKPFQDTFAETLALEYEWNEKRFCRKVGGKPNNSSLEILLPEGCAITRS